MLDVKNLVKVYGANRAVDGINFSVDRGEIVGFLGPNGAGKSTTMKIITCFIAPDGGSVSVAGNDVLTQSLEVRRRIGYLPENCPVYEDMGVVEFLDFVAGVRGLPGGKARKQRIGEVVDRCGLKREVHKLIGQLSRGNRQRVGLAQALIHDPDILILDEPTSALDPGQIKEIRELIKEIGKSKTILLSTHIMQEVTATCNRAIIISRGRIVASGSPAELTSRSRGTRAFHLEVKAPPETIENAIRAMEGVDTVSAARHEKDGAWSVATAAFHQSAAEPGERLFTLARDKNWMLRELREERVTLEDVFIQLTRKN